MKVASTKLTNPEWEELQNMCNDSGLTIAEYLRQLIRNETGQIRLMKSDRVGESQEQSQEGNTDSYDRESSGIMELLRRTKMAPIKGQAVSFDAETAKLQKLIKDQNAAIQTIRGEVQSMKNKIDVEIIQQLRSVIREQATRRPLDCTTLKLRPNC
jgi:hypothetical protein